MNNELIKFRIILNYYNDYDLPLIEITKLMDKLSIKSNIALYFSRANVPNTDVVLNYYIDQYKINVLNKNGSEKADYILIFDKIMSNAELLKIMEQHGLNLYYINTKSIADFSEIESIFNEKNSLMIDSKLFELTHYEVLVYFDIDRTIDISFNSNSFTKEKISELLYDWLKSVKVHDYDIQELK